MHVRVSAGQNINVQLIRKVVAQTAYQLENAVYGDAHICIYMYIGRGSMEKWSSHYRRAAFFLWCRSSYITSAETLKSFCGALEWLCRTPVSLPQKHASRHVRHC